VHAVLQHWPRESAWSSNWQTAYSSPMLPWSSNWQTAYSSAPLSAFVLCLCLQLSADVDGCRFCVMGCVNDRRRRRRCGVTRRWPAALPRQIQRRSELHAIAIHPWCLLCSASSGGERRRGRERPGSRVCAWTISGVSNLSRGCPCLRRVVFVVAVC